MAKHQLDKLQIQAIVSELLDDPHEIELALLFGSFASGKAQPQSDVDIAVLAKKPFSFEAKVTTTQRLTQLLHREVDLVDLSHCGPTVKEEALTQGKVILNSNPAAYAQLIKTFLFDKEDWGRWRDFIRAERRKKVFKL